MANKTIPIQEKDFARLREILRQEESRLDTAQPSDAELVFWEAKQEASIRQALKQQGDTNSLDSDKSDVNWSLFQKRLTSAKIKPQQAHPLPLILAKFKSRKAILPWLGAAVAAALIALVLKPSVENLAIQRPEGGQTFKGAEAHEQVDCAVDARAADGVPIVQLENGQGFEGPMGATVQLSIKCSRAGFLQGRALGPANLSFTNIPIKANERQGISQNGSLASFVIQIANPWAIDLVLTNRELSEASPLLWDAATGESSSEQSVQWSDNISIRGHR